MSGFYDATCTKCRKRFGWCGELKDKPPCPKCRHHDKISQEESDRIEKMMEDSLREAREVELDAQQADKELHNYKRRYERDD